MTMCEHAAAARARNSPAAPTLAKRCAAEGGPPPSVGFGRVRVPPPPPAPTVPALPTPAPPMTPAPIDPARFDPAQLDALAATGADIAGIDPAVDEARHVESGAFYQLGFDIATALFGDPILGAAGKANLDASSESIRDSLSASGQRGFDASMKFHLVRH